MDLNVLKRVKRRDRIARWVITVGGMSIIASVLLILLLIAKVALPLFQDARGELFASYPLPEGLAAEAVLNVGLDDYLEKTFVLTRDGAFLFLAADSGAELERIVLPPPTAGARVTMASGSGLEYTLLWNDGTVTVEQVEFSPTFDERGRTFSRQVLRLATFSPPEQQVLRAAVHLRDEQQTRVLLLADGRLAVGQDAVATDLFGEESRESHFVVLREAMAGAVSAFTLDGDGRYLYVGSTAGELLRWDLGEAGEPELLDRLTAFADGRSITALNMLFGDISLAVGDAQGGLATWFAVPTADGRPALRRIHPLGARQGAVLDILPSRRDKSLLSLDAAGTVHLDHATSERSLLTLAAHRPVLRMGYAGRGDGVIGLTEEGQLLVWKLHNPHPEISLKTLFGKVWYEGYPAPAHVWQSSSGNDDFEPKLSLTPLVFGTLKGTFYAMLLAVPLALLAAIYTSQFGSTRMRQIIKPTVEVMAAIPSVVIGFLAALWFAPLLERFITPFFLSMVFIPSAFILAILGWQLLRRWEPLRIVERGYEFLLLVPILLLTLAIAWLLGPLFEQLLFGGNFKQWLFDSAGTRYDPRNSIVIAFALGFAVIPLIFTITEDALSNVPGSLRAASLAMGASRWQTVWRVVLPSASPGIFAAVMIGLGRAIGETMIVLMATGNTPLIDLSMFNGMRPLSSNIAVEVPEAPVGGTLYRILFLSAVILFMFTFVLNTAAELVRQRLRKKYGRF